MAQERIDLTLPEKFGMLLPRFSGKENELHSFLRSAEQFLFMFANEAQIIKDYCFAVVKSKLTDRALAEVSTSDIPNNWDVLKRFLNTKFGDQINLDVLIHQLQFLAKKPHEDMLNFIDKIISLKIRINYRIDSDPMPDPEKLIYKSNILKICKTVLISNSPMELRTYLITNNAFNFDNTVNAVKDYLCNMAQYELLDRSRNKNPIHKNVSRNNYSDHRNNTNKYNHFSNNNYRTQHYETQHRFPSRPIQFTQRQVNTHYPTQRETFGVPSTSRNQNVFKPNPNQRITTPPERMSVQTRVYPQKRPNYSTQYQNNPQRKFYNNNDRSPDFLVEELTNIDINPNKRNSFSQPSTSKSNFSNERNFQDPILENELT